MKWEYKIATLLPGEVGVALFDEFGGQGWELVALRQDGRATMAYFKRVKPIEIAPRVTNGLDVIARFDAFAHRQPTDAISRYQIELPKTAPYSHAYRVRPEDLTNVESVRTELEDCCL